MRVKDYKNVDCCDKMYRPSNPGCMSKLFFNHSSEQTILYTFLFKTTSYSTNKII